MDFQRSDRPQAQARGILQYGTLHFAPCLSLKRTDFDLLPDLTHSLTYSVIEASPSLQYSAAISTITASGELEFLLPKHLSLGPKLTVNPDQPSRPESSREPRSLPGPGNSATMRVRPPSSQTFLRRVAVDQCVGVQKR